jgi:hypothetical protein
VLTVASATVPAPEALKAAEAHAALVAAQAADAAATVAAPPVEVKPAAPPPPPKKPSYFGAPRTASNGAAHLPW